MKKAFVFFLSLVLVMSLALPAFAVGSPIVNPYKPVVVEGVVCPCRIVLWSERDILSSEAKAAFEAAKETVKDVVPEGFACRDLVYHRDADQCAPCTVELFFSGASVADDAEKAWNHSTADVNICEAYEVEMSIEGVTEVVIKQYENNEWVEKEVTLNGGVVTVKNIMDAPVAIFTK